MNRDQALQSFWGSFTWPAYEEHTVPDDAKFPYITYEASSDDFGNTVYLSAYLWDRSNSWADILTKANAIADYISRGGRIVKYDGGAMWIQKATPWAQRMEEPEDREVRRIGLSISIEYLD